MIGQKHLLLSLGLVLASCSSDNDGSLVTQIIEDPDGLESTYTVSLKGEAAVTASPVQLVYRLYGFDPLLADVSATLVHESTLSLDSLPATASLKWPFDPASLIRPPVSSEESAKFYMSLSVDLDMDGQLCNGDLAQDYSLTDFFTVQGMPAETVDYYLTTINRADEACEGY